MYIVPVAWLYVALMMAVAEATNSTGTVLGAFITFFLYGVGPVALLVYIMGGPGRKRAIRAREALEMKASAQSSATERPDDAAPLDQHNPG